MSNTDTAAIQRMSEEVVEQEGQDEAERVEQGYRDFLAERRLAEGLNEYDFPLAEESP